VSPLSNAKKRKGTSFSDLVPGARIFDQYEIVKLLGVGSAGLVYLCNHIQLSNYPLAVKIFNYSRNELDLKRFKREILSAYNVNHPNVIRCYEYLCSDELIAFTMEYIQGGTLNEKIQKDELSDYSKIVSTLVSICSGLDAIHKAGVVHRDLKPENVLFTLEGQVKIADFSIAHHELEPKLNTGSVIGTIDYISPEYLAGKTIDARIDLYALGVIAYQMVTGKIPCKGKNPYHTLKIRTEQKAEPLSVFRKDCPVILEKIIMKALEPNPSDRYQSADKMLKDLMQFSRILSSKTSVHFEENRADSFRERPMVSKAWQRSFFEKLEVVSFGALFSLAGVGASYLASVYLF